MESLVGIDLKDTSDGRLEKMNKQLKFPITLNIATCLYRKKEYKKAIVACDKILEEDQKFIPVFYKKGFILFKMGELAESKYF